MFSTPVTSSGRSLRVATRDYEELVTYPCSCGWQPAVLEDECFGYTELLQPAFGVYGCSNFSVNIRRICWGWAGRF